MLKRTGGTPRITLSAGPFSVTFPTHDLRMVLPVEEPLAVPRMRQGMVGVIVRQSRVIPVFALSALFSTVGADPDRSVPASSIVVVEQDGALAGFLVDTTGPAGSNPEGSQDPSDGIRLLAEAGIFNDPPGDEPAAIAASGAI